jgi:predicted PurR-regulated permease PerM
VNKTRNIPGVQAISKLLAVLAFASLPGSVLAQTATPVNDQIKELQNAIRNIQKQYQTQIHGLQKQLDDLKAAQGGDPEASATSSTGGSHSTGNTADGRRATAAGAGRTGRSAASN